MAKRGKKSLNYFEAHPNKKQALRLNYQKGPDLVRQRCKRLARALCRDLGVAAGAANLLASAINNAAIAIRSLAHKIPNYKGRPVMFTTANNRLEVIEMPSGIFKSPAYMIWKNDQQDPGDEHQHPTT